MSSIVPRAAVGPCSAVRYGDGADPGRQPHRRHCGLEKRGRTTGNGLQMSDVAVCAGVCMAIGSFGGALAGTSSCDLATQVSSEAIARSGVAPAEIDQSVFVM